MAGERESPTSDQDYRSYLLRLWRATYDGEPVWRASLESPQTGERTGFCNLEALFRHLQEQTPTGTKTEKGGADQ